MPTPICHRLMACPITYTDGDGATCTETALRAGVAACIGSRCAMWVPKLWPVEVWERSDDGGRVWVPETPENMNAPGYILRRRAPAHSGVCADNTDREPWPDPAAEKEG